MLDLPNILLEEDTKIQDSFLSLNSGKRKRVARFLQWCEDAGYLLPDVSEVVLAEYGRDIKVIGQFFELIPSEDSSVSLFDAPLRRPPIRIVRASSEKYIWAYRKSTNSVRQRLRNFLRLLEYRGISSLDELTEYQVEKLFEDAPQIANECYRALRRYYRKLYLAGKIRESDAPVPVHAVPRGRKERKFPAIDRQ